jgi:hypothetical protein
MCIPHPSLLTKQRGNRTVTAPVPATTIVSFLAVSETSRYDEADEEETDDDDDVQWESTCAALAPHLPPPCSSKNKKPQVLANVTGDCEQREPALVRAQRVRVEREGGAGSWPPPRQPPSTLPAGLDPATTFLPRLGAAH